MVPGGFLKSTDNAFSTLVATITNSQTTLQVQNSDVAKFPSTFPFRITVWYATNNISTSEVMNVTSASGNVFTVTRAVEGPNGAQAWNVSTGVVNVWHNFTAGTLQEVQGIFNTLTSNSDLLTITGGSYARLPVGSNNQILAVVGGALGYNVTFSATASPNVLPLLTGSSLLPANTVGQSSFLAEAWNTMTITGYAASGSMTFTSVTTTEARYYQTGKTFTYKLSFTGTIGGSVSNAILINIPYTRFGTQSAGAAGYGNISNAQFENANVYWNSTSQTQIAVSRPAFVNYASGTATINIEGTIELA